MIELPAPIKASIHKVLIGADGTQYDLKNSKGYHDHDWGMWMLPDRVWSWAQFSTDDHQVAFDIGFHAAFQKSTAYMKWGEKNLYFPQDKFKATQSAWEDWWHFWEYPTIVNLQAIDATGNYLLQVQWQVNATATLWKYPLIVFEQACDFTGHLYAYDSCTGSKGQSMLDIKTSGFCEYTDRWLGSQSQ